VDEARRAVVTVFVVDRSFGAFFGDPRTREAALVQLGRTLRRVHDLPLPPDAESSDPLGLLAAVWARLTPGFALPAFVVACVERVLAEPPPAPEGGLVFSHNDVNPTNLAYDGENILLLDWNTAGPNDASYDLAAISVFLRMDEASCTKLLSAHEAHEVAALPARFSYCRRVVAALCGATFLDLARQSGHPGARGDETLEATLALGDFYQRLRSGGLSLASGEGQWGFGLALVRASLVE
jgi:aminoglycoside phosphotransferase (APT) family kinase protein